MDHGSPLPSPRPPSSHSQSRRDYNNNGNMRSNNNNRDEDWVQHQALTLSHAYSFECAKANDAIHNLSDAKRNVCLFNFIFNLH